MKVLVAPDKFKGSLEAADVCRAVREGVTLAYPEAEVVSVPLADGGEGTTRILTEFSHGHFVTAKVRDPLGRSIDAQYGISADGITAFIEMASASGLLLLTPDEYNPLRTSTFGTGELILHAISQGVQRVILGIGGSATTDGGIGMAAALGFRFLDGDGRPLEPVGASLAHIRQIDDSRVKPALAKIVFTVACDVTNPLYGAEGAAFVYGPQKGASAAMVEMLDQGLQNLAVVADAFFNTSVAAVPGAGAAGGLGAGAVWFLNAALREGVGIVMEYTGLASLIRTVDLVITGEGKVDVQTLQGKVVKGLADSCRTGGKPLAVICGALDISPDQAREAGIMYAASVLKAPTDLEAAKAMAYENVRDATFHLVRLFFASR